MPLSENEVLIVNLKTGAYMVADHYALVSRGMPDGYQVAEKVRTKDWLVAIADETGNDRYPVPDDGDDWDVFVNLSTGGCIDQHKRMTSVHGAPEGYANLAEVGTVDLLDALRKAKGLEPVDRSEMGEALRPSP